MSTALTQPDSVYAELRPAERALLRAATAGIRREVGRAALGAYNTGQHLLRVKDLLEHGQFGRWLAAEFSWTRRTAERLMLIAVRFAGKSDTLSLFSLSAVHLLAAPSTPPEAVAEAEDDAAAGRKITGRQARRLVHRAKARRLKALPLPVRAELERVGRKQRLKRIDALLLRARQLASGLGRAAAAATAQLDLARAQFARLAGS